jgi:hypothetical protein
MTSAGVAAGVARGAAITTSIIATAVSVAVVASAVASAPVESTIVPRPTNYYIRKTVLRLRQRLVSFEWKSSRSTNRWMGRLLKDVLGSDSIFSRVAMNCSTPELGVDLFCELSITAEFRTTLQFLFHVMFIARDTLRTSHFCGWDVHVGAWKYQTTIGGYKL